MSRASDLLELRARELARPRTQETAGAELEVVIFAVGRERYAFDLRWVREVRALRQLTRLPGAPAHVLGIANVRGRILAVVDIRRFFGIPSRALGDLDKLVVIAGAGMEFGVLADAVLGTNAIPESELQRAVSTFAGIREACLRGVTRDGIAVLDAARLLADESLVARGAPGNNE